MLVDLIALLVYCLVAAFVIVWTFGLSPAAYATLRSALGVLPRLPRSRRLRRNLALLHATINVIEERHGPSRLAGAPAAEGFLLRGAAPFLIASAAEEAAGRLRAGERRLAVHPRSPVALVAALGLIGALLLVALIALGASAWPAMLAGSLAAVLLGPRLSLLLQRWLLADAAIGQLDIARVESREPVGRLGLVALVFLNPVFVYTTEREAARDAGQLDGGRVTVITGEREEVTAGGYRVR